MLLAERTGAEWEILEGAEWEDEDAAGGDVQATGVLVANEVEGDAGGEDERDAGGTDGEGEGGIRGGGGPKAWMRVRER